MTRSETEHVEKRNGSDRRVVPYVHVKIGKECRAGHASQCVFHSTVLLIR